MPATSPLADAIDGPIRAASPRALGRDHDVLTKWGVARNIYIFSRLEWGRGERESDETPQTNPELESEQLYTGHRQRIGDAFRVWRGDVRAYFDP